MSYYTIEQWTIKSVAEAFLPSGDKNNRKVIIPIFQRGLRWKDQKKVDFIDSLNRGYPFGSLLFAKHDTNTYAVVDGLQRGSTVCDYVFNPLTKNNLSAIDDDVLDSIREALFPGNFNKSINDHIKNVLFDYYEKARTFDNVDSFKLSQTLMENFPTNENPWTCANKINAAISPFYQSIKERYDRICSAMVPIIVYSGPN